MNNAFGIIAAHAGSTGAATVDGAGSRWTTAGDLYVGHNGNGTLTIHNGGTVSNWLRLSRHPPRADRHRDGGWRRLDLDQ